MEQRGVKMQGGLKCGDRNVLIPLPWDEPPAARVVQRSRFLGPTGRQCKVQRSVHKVKKVKQADDHRKAGQRK